jgi:hypothetical protein
MNASLQSSFSQNSAHALSAANSDTNRPVCVIRAPRPACRSLIEFCPFRVRQHDLVLIETIALPFFVVLDH